MKLEFTTREITEYSNGALHIENTGKPFEVFDELAKVLLMVTHPVGGEMVNIFRVSETKLATKPVPDKPSVESADISKEK